MKKIMLLCLVVILSSVNLLYVNAEYCKRECCSNCELKDILLELNKTLVRIEKQTSHIQPIGKDCAELRKRGYVTDGVYQISPDGTSIFSVRCDMTTDGGGWTIFQRRIDGSVDFYRSWQDYKIGFGHLNSEFWLGLDKIYQLTQASANKLRVDMEDWLGNKVHALYSSVLVSDEQNKYKLTVGGYTGNAGDSLTRHSGKGFSTKDADNDSYASQCAVVYKGAWWYAACHSSNLNGLYHNGTHTSYADGVNWNTWKGYYYSLKKTEMKIRPSNF